MQELSNLDMTPLRYVKRHARVARRELELRDQAIISAWEEGHSLRVIGEAAGLSHSAISWIVRRA